MRTRNSSRSFLIPVSRIKTTMSRRSSFVRGRHLHPVRAATALDTPILGRKGSSKNVEVVGEMAWLHQLTEC